MTSNGALGSSLPSSAETQATLSAAWDAAVDNKEPHLPAPAEHVPQSPNVVVTGDARRTVPVAPGSPHHKPRSTRSAGSSVLGCGTGPLCDWTRARALTVMARVWQWAGAQPESEWLDDRPPLRAPAAGYGQQPQRGYGQQQGMQGGRPPAQYQGYQPAPAPVQVCVASLVCHSCAASAPRALGDSRPAHSRILAERVGDGGDANSVRRITATRSRRNNGRHLSSTSSSSVLARRMDMGSRRYARAGSLFPVHRCVGRRASIREQQTCRRSLREVRCGRSIFGRMK